MKIYHASMWGIYLPNFNEPAFRNPPRWFKRQKRIWRRRYISGHISKNDVPNTRDEIIKFCNDPQTLMREGLVFEGTTAFPAYFYYRKPSDNDRRVFFFRGSNLFYWSSWIFNVDQYSDLLYESALYLKGEP